LGLSFLSKTCSEFSVLKLILTFTFCLNDSLSFLKPSPKLSVAVNVSFIYTHLIEFIKLLNMYNSSSSLLQFLFGNNTFLYLDE